MKKLNVNYPINNFSIDCMFKGYYFGYIRSSKIY